MAWHPKSEGHTKVGYSKWHPLEADERYSFKRVHQIGRYLVSFGFGPLEAWASDHLNNAKEIERLVHRALATHRRNDVGPSTDIFNISPSDAIELVKEHINAQTH